MRLRMYISSITVFVLLLSGGNAIAAEESMPLQYKGSFVVERYAGASYYWYVDPVSEKRFSINTSSDFSRLLSKLGQGITKATLAKLPSTDTLDRRVAYETLMRYRGTIMLQTDADGKAWYLNPLDLKLYYLQNGKAGFQTVMNLALDITNERLQRIPVTDELGFNYVRTGILPDGEEGLDTNVYGEVYRLLQSQHIAKDTFTAQDLFYGSLRGMVEATGDINSEFYPPDKNKKQHEYFMGGASIEGIGAAIEAKNRSIYVQWLVKGAPAERIGLKPKDQIVAIDGQSTEGISVDAAVARIKGPAGTTVKLMVYRGSSGVQSEYTIVRERVDIPEVEAELLGNDVAYFKFSLFTADLIPEFQKLFEKVITPSVRGVVVDMRDNIGGVTQSSAQLVDYWLKENQLIFTERRPGQEMNYVASGGREMPLVPTVILVNDQTASASEIFTAALKYYNEAKVIGVTTYGKGTGQNLYDFEDGSGLKLTTFEWLPPDGTSINAKGITPDIVIPASDYGDPQLDRALQLIRIGY